LVVPDTVEAPYLKEKLLKAFPFGSIWSSPVDVLK